MSTDQTTPPPTSVTLPPAAAALPGAAGVVGPDDGRTPDDGTSRSAAGHTGQPAGHTGQPAGHAGQSSAGQPAAGGAAPSGRPVGSSWRAEAAGELVAMSFPGARRIAGWLFWVVFPLLCIGSIHTSVTNVVHHLGNKPVGIRGTFVVQPRSCNQGFCSFGGLFTSDDGAIKNLPLLGDPRWRTAEVHKVTYDSRSVEVTPLPGHWNPTPSVMAFFGALTYLGAIGYFLRQRRRSGAERRASPALEDPVPTG